MKTIKTTNLGPTIREYLKSTLPLVKVKKVSTKNNSGTTVNEFSYYV